MFIYETSPQDYFDGMVPLCDAIYNSGENEGSNDTAWRIIHFVISCVYKVARAKSFWEGDIRGNDIYLFSLPDPDNAMVRMGLVWKQDNNGSTYICSPVEIPWLKEYRDITTGKRYKFKKTRDVS